MQGFIIPKKIDFAIHNILNGVPRREKIEQISYVIDYIEQAINIMKKQKNQESEFCQELQKVVKQTLQKLIPHEKLYKLAVNDISKCNYSGIAHKAAACLN